MICSNGKIIYIVILFLETVVACDKAEIPSLNTVDVNDVQGVSAQSGGIDVQDGGSPIIAKGVCWGYSTDPDIRFDLFTIDGSGSGNFISKITGLHQITSYYVRAYATNKAGTGYGNSVKFTTPSAQVSFNFNISYGTMTDQDSNVYKTVKIGNQVWMAENLETTHYKNGESIPLVPDSGLFKTDRWTSLTSGAYCEYNNGQPQNSNYGYLYNWYAVSDTRKLCPDGWHIPSNKEWLTLEDYLGGKEIAGGKLKETGTSHWLPPNEGATNESGFSAVPGGHRIFRNVVDQLVIGPFNYINLKGYYWTADEDIIQTKNSIAKIIDTNYGILSTGSQPKSWGFSVRCIADSK